MIAFYLQAVMGILWSDLHVVDNLGATPFFEGRAFPEFLGACVGLPAALELYAERVEEEHVGDKSYFPGQLDLDPFHFYPASTRGQRRMQFTEIMVGRICMVGAAERLTQYLLTGLGVMNQEDSLLSLLVPVQSAVENMEEVIL
jgi:Chlorophyll A-B binding protein